MGKEWAYRLGAASDAVQEAERDFIFMVPFNFALKIKYAGLNRGLLKSIEFQQGDSSLPALRMTFNNGSEERQCAFGHWQFLDETLNFTKPIRKISMTYNTRVSRVEFNEEQSAQASNHGDPEDRERQFTLKPGQQIVGIYGKMDQRGAISWFNFILTKPDWYDYEFNGKPV